MSSRCHLFPKPKASAEDNSSTLNEKKSTLVLWEYVKCYWVQLYGGDGWEDGQGNFIFT